jgi:uncharacterized damage-inducible protein DinB
MSQQAEVAERTGKLETAVRALLQRVEGLDADRLYREPAPGEWSVMMGLAHVAEVLPYWSRQAREVAGRPRDNEPFGRTHEDPDRIAAVEQHANDRLDDVLRRLRDGLAEATRTMRELPPEGWAKTASHSRRGEMRVADIIDEFLIDHVVEHTRQVEATLDAVQ